MSLMRKLERDTLQRQCKQEIEALHGLFVAWFQGTRARAELEQELNDRLENAFSHVAPNGMMVLGRPGLLGQLQDKYACYQDRVFGIDIYNVQLLWTDANKCLCTYEEWQSWERHQDDSEDEEEEDDEEDGGLVQFGRLSTCLLEKPKDSKNSGAGGFTWVHVHETWLEAEKPPTTASGSTGNNSRSQIQGDEETIMTGPMQASEMLKQKERQAAATAATAAALRAPPSPQAQSKNAAPAAAPPPPANERHSSVSSANVELVDNPDPPRLIVLLSNQSLSREQASQQAKAKIIIHSLQIPFDEIDGTNFHQRGIRNILFDISGAFGKYPQFFTKNGEIIRFWGDWKKFNQNYEEGTLRRELGLVIPANQPVGEESAPPPVTPPKPQAGPPQQPTRRQQEEEEDEEDSEEDDSEEDSDEESSSEEEEDTENDGGGGAQAKEFDYAAAVAGTTNVKEAANPFAAQQRQMAAAMASNNKAPVTPQNPFNDKPQQQQQEAQGVAAAMAALNAVMSGQEPKAPAAGAAPPTPKQKEDDSEDSEIEGSLEGGVAEEGEEGSVRGPSEASFEKEMTEEELAARAAQKDREQEDKEKAFMEASQGILNFEESEDEKDEDSALEEEEVQEVNGEGVSPIPQDVSPKRHVSPKLNQYAKPLTWESAVVGVSVAGFDIGTSQGPIGDDLWYEEMGRNLEELAQSRSVPKPRRKICLPDMVFPTAHVALEGYGLWLSWDVSDALEEWANCHEEIAIHSRIAHKGVSVLRSKDTAIWEAKRKHRTDDDESSSTFHFDWTYSTPFCGRAEGGQWQELDESGMRMSLLTDQSVPILFFDDICLYEDDLQDQGQVQYTIKLRVMPSCAYLLARLWVRVDNVLLRVKETRILVDFFGMKPSIYRDLSWRECQWEELPSHSLPTDVRSWHLQGRETPEWNALVKALPEVDLPRDMYKHAVLSAESLATAGGGASGS